MLCCAPLVSSLSSEKAIGGLTADRSLPGPRVSRSYTPLKSNSRRLTKFCLLAATESVKLSGTFERRNIAAEGHDLFRGIGCLM